MVILQKRNSKKNSKGRSAVADKNLKICNGRCLIQSHSQLTNASRKGWGAVCQGISRGKWSKEEQLLHIREEVHTQVVTKNVKLTLVGGWV